MRLALVLGVLGTAFALMAPTAQAQTILIYDNNSTNMRAIDAATRLGLTFTRAMASDFVTLLSGSRWDLVVMDNPSSEPTGDWQTPLVAHITAGGRAIHTHWNSGSLAGLPAAFQVTIGTSHDSIPLYRWSGDALFSTPQVVPDSLSMLTDIWGTNGFRLEATGGARAAGGFTMAPSPNEVGIVVGNSQRTIWNGFLFDDYGTADTDTDGIPDITELVMNEIALLAAVFPTAPCVGLMEGAACTATPGGPGLCRGGVCCYGCWTGTRCERGMTATVCGIAGAMCRTCADGDLCSTDVCTAGVCSNPDAPAGTTCDDAMFCTRTDTCNATGTCGGAGARCDDAEECTTDSCNEAADTCTNAPRPELTACMTGGRAGMCRTGRCCAGCYDGMLCQVGTGAAACGVGGGMCSRCIDGDGCTSDVCAAGACSNPDAPRGTSCDDTMFCTTTDTCDGSGACTSGPARVCNDMASCTSDMCDEAMDRCVFTPTAGCTIGGVCVGEGTVNPTYPCQVCDPARDTTDWSFLDVGETCGPSSCAGGRLTARQCDAAGVCQTLRSMCPSGACADTMTCEMPCMAGSCPAGMRCDPVTIMCVMLGDPGDACMDDADCASGFCVDGTCCTVACDGVCERCDGAGGTCDPVAAGVDPDDECADAACDGTGACEGMADAGPTDAGRDGGGDGGGTDGGGGTDSGRTDAGPGPGDDGGCGCRASGTGGRPTLALALLVLVTLLARRRRRG